MKAKYGLTAMLRLAREYGRGPVLIADLATEEGIPKKFLELILLELKQNGVLKSKKGKGGGYLLGRPPQDISVGEILAILEGNLAPVPCLGRADAAPCSDCLDPASCPIRHVMREVHQATSGILDGTTLDQLTGLKRSRLKEAPQRYHI
jgi:Rrf2 family protein